MSGNYLLTFHRDNERTLLLPEQCSVSISCPQSRDVQKALIKTIQEPIYALAISGMDPRSLDGVTVALDARIAACNLQALPDGVIPLEMTDLPETTMDLARTIVVRRGDDFRFHIVLRAGLALMTLFPESEHQALACGCFTHEAAHVEHEGH